MVVEIHKLGIELLLLRLFAAQEGNLLAVRDQLRMGAAELPIQLLLPRCQLPEGRQCHRGDHRGHREPPIEGQRCSEALHPTQLDRVHDEIDDGLEGLREDGGEEVGEEVDVARHLMVRVFDLCRPELVGLRL